MTFDAWAALDDEAPEQESTSSTAPSACSYCGGAEFDAPTDNGRVSRATCTACKGTMVSHDGVYWQPDLIGQPDNHPSTQADPRSGGVGGIGDAPVVRREEDLNSRTAGVDWCRHRRSEHCWLPRNDSAHSGFALYIPQDRGVCPWTTASMQQINCPMSEPGPMAGMERAGAWQDPEWRFHVVAAWRDVRAKAKRIRAEGGVSIVSVLADGVTGHVHGDTGVYESQINYVPGSFKIGHWQCGCAWASYAWGRSPAFKRFEGRMCSHSLALQYEAQSRGMFGREVAEDTQRPGWMRDKVRVRHDRVTRDHDVREAALRRLDPDGVYPTDHGLDLEGAPIHAFAAEAYAHRGDPADAMRVFLIAGLEHAEARALLDSLPRVVAKDEPLAEPTHAGVALKAADTGRILMIQRSNQDETDPAAGTWELPGGGREDGDHNSLMSAVREFEEEVGQEFPTGGHVSHVWQSPNGVYQGHVVVVPSESALDFSNGRRTTNPDDPDGDDHEQSAWWDPDHARKNPALRPECKAMPWDKIKTASLGTEAGIFTRKPTGPDTRPPADPADEKPMRACDGCKSCAVCGDKSVAVDTLWDHGLCPEHLHARQSGEDPIRDAGRLKPVLAGAWHVGTRHTAVDDLATSPTITRGMVLDGGQQNWHPEVARRISQGQATLHDLMSHIHTKDVGNFWHGHHDSLEDAKDYAGPTEEHVGHEVGSEPYHNEAGDPIHYGEVGAVLEAHRPRGWDPNQNHDDGLMGNSYLPHATDLQLHKIHYNDHHGDWHELNANGHTVHADGEAQYLHHSALAEFRRRVADYASGDFLEDMGIDPRPKAPPKAPEPEQDKNPGSTGWATSQDPVEWENASQNPGSMSLTSWSSRAELHDHPEPALPTTTGEDDEQVVEPPGERYRAQMRPEIDPTEDMGSNDGRTASVTDIVERFQATAGARALQQQKGPDTVDIAAAARAHLEDTGMRRTALKEFSSAEQHALITEGAGDARARNFDSLDIAGTHYADLAAALDSQSALDEAADELFS